VLFFIEGDVIMFKFTVEDYHYHSEDYIGICTNCGAERDCTEPDADEYPCEECGENAVKGADNLLIDGFYGESEG
jgi:hypothetical protein